MVTTLPGVPAKTTKSATNLMVLTTGGVSLTTIPVGDANCEENVGCDTYLLMNLNVNINMHMIYLSNIKQKQQQHYMLYRRPVTVLVFAVVVTSVPATDGITTGSTGRPMSNLTGAEP